MPETSSFPFPTRHSKAVRAAGLLPSHQSPRQDVEPITGQYDAFTGLLLKGDGKGEFKPLLFSQSGFLADGDCKSVIGVKGTGRSYFVVTVNKGPLQVFQRIHNNFVTLPNTADVTRR